MMQSTNPPPSKPRSFLITGATGKQGGAVIDALLRLPEGIVGNILAVTRDANSPASKRIAALDPKIKIVEGNLDNPKKLFFDAEQANAGLIDSVFSVLVSHGPGHTNEREIKHGKALIDQARLRGVKHLVYSSVERGGDEQSWDNPTTVEHFKPKLEIERHLRSGTLVDASQTPALQHAPMKWTILRPVAFMENLEANFPTRVFLAALNNHLGHQKKMQWVSIQDIGVFAAKAFRNPEQWNGRAVGLAGDEMTMEELFAVFNKATGKGSPATYWPLGSLFTYVIKPVGQMIQWFAWDGYNADVEARRAEHPGMMTVERWLAGGGGGFVKQRRSYEP